MYHPERNKLLWAEHVEKLGEAAFHLYDTYFRTLYVEYRRNTQGSVASESEFFSLWRENSNEGNAFNLLLGLDPNVANYFGRYRS